MPRRKPHLRAGKQLDPVGKAGIIGPSTADDLILFFNAFMNATMELGEIVITDHKILFNNRRASSSSSGSSAAFIAGEWDPAAIYDAGVIVFFTPDGESAGTFYSLQAVPAGISPDTGAPYWSAFPNSPPSVFA